MLRSILWLTAFILFSISCHPVLPDDKPSAESVTVLPATRKVSSGDGQETHQQPEQTKTPVISQEPPAIPTALPTAALQGEPVVVSAADPRIYYHGRFDFSDPEHVYFDWSGVTIEAAFRGSSLTVLLDDGANYYNVSIDGHEQILQTVPEKTRYEVAQNLPNSTHTFRLTKRTEAYVGGATFSGFILDAGQDLVDQQRVTERWIEFVGDSITTGYGNEGGSPTCWFTADTQNIARTYAALTAQHFDAEYSIVALSGLGVVRNLRAAGANSEMTASDFLDRTVAMNAYQLWDVKANAPDVVVVNLGTNDFSSLPFPAEDVFVEAYVNLLLQIREQYPQATIFALSGPLMLGPASLVISSAVERLQTEHDDRRVHYVLIENNLDESQDFGCDWHPNVKGHQKIVAQLVKAMSGVLDWPNLSGHSQEDHFEYNPEPWSSHRNQ